MGILVIMSKYSGAGAFAIFASDSNGTLFSILYINVQEDVIGCWNKSKTKKTCKNIMKYYEIRNIYI